MPINRALVAMVLAACAVPAGAANISWGVHIGVWSVAGNWIGGVPTAGDNVFVTDPGRLEQVTINVSPSINALTLSDFGLSAIADSITLTNNLSLTITGGGFLNDGQFLIQSSGNLTTLSFVGAQTVAGRGAIVMSDNPGNRIVTNNTVLQHGNGFGHEIRGAGQLLNNTGGLWNLSTVRQQGSNALVIDPNGLGVDNDGLLVAEGSGGLSLINGTFDNAGGEIRANDQSKVVLSGATIEGGTLSTLGSGIIEVSASILDGVSNLGAIDQGNNTTVTIQNDLLHNGTWSLNSTGNLTSLFFNGAQAVTGNGTISLSDNAANRLTNNNTVTTLGAGITVRGAGRILDNTGGLINDGTIIAEGGNALAIDPNGNDFVNNGVLRAAGPGGLQLINGVFNLNAPLEVLNGSALQVSGATLNLGTLDIAAGIAADIRSSTLNGVTIDGDVVQGNNLTNTIVNGLTVNGTWSLNSTGNLTSLFFNGAQTLGGNGTVVMGDNGANRLTNNNTVTTLGAGITVRGAGRILDNTGGLDNQGAIIAEGGNALVIDPNGNDFVNNGVLRAAGPGGLQLINGVFNLNAPLEVLNGSALLVSGATLNLGTLDIAAGVAADIRSSTLNGMTIDGDVVQGNNLTNTIVNGLTVNGTWSLNSTGHLTSLLFSGAQTLGGNGTVVMGDNGANRLANNNTVTTLGAGITVRGAGRILDNTGGLINDGTIIAEGGNALVIDPNGNDFVNNGVLRAAGPGGLQLINGVFNLNAPVEVLNGSALQVSGATLNLGTLDIAAGVAADIRSSTLNGMTIDGDVVQGNNLTNTIVNGLTVNGTSSLNSTGHLTSLLFSGAQILGGNGSVVMSDNGANRLVNNNTVTTLGAGITVRGAGRILDNTGGMINEGTLIADATNALRIDPNGLGFENRGVVRAQGAGGIQSVDDYRQTAGTTVVTSTFDITNRTLIVDGGTLTGNGTIIGDVANNAGVVGPGNSPGTLTIDGDYSQGASGELLIEIAGLADFDALSITGSAELGGTLAVTLLDGFLPQVGQGFDILLADDINGIFANGQFVDAGGAIFEILYLDGLNGDTVRLTTVSAVPLPAGVWLMLSALVTLVARRRPRTR